jgi:hypothetical protein
MLKNGRIKKSNELYSKAQLNKYFHPETPVNVLSLASLQEFCETPRITTEITQYFNISSNMSISHYLQPLIKAGKMFTTRPQGSPKVYEHTNRVAHTVTALYALRRLFRPRTDKNHKQKPKP